MNSDWYVAAGSATDAKATLKVSRTGLVLEPIPLISFERIFKNYVHSSENHLSTLGSRKAMLTSRTLGIIASALLVTSVSAAYYSHALPVYNISSVNTPEPCKRSQDSILVIQDGSGFNGSSTHGAPSNPWPKVHVHKGDTVNIIVCNVDKVQAHGFAINHYFDRGTALGPGQMYRLSFIAKDPGSFVIYCVVFCSAHNFMVAELIVT